MMPSALKNVAAIGNPDAIVPIDEIVISLTNPASLVANPVGIDNLIVARRCAETTAAPVSGLWSRHD